MVRRPRREAMGPFFLERIREEPGVYTTSRLVWSGRFNRTEAWATIDRLVASGAAHRDSRGRLHPGPPPVETKPLGGLGSSQDEVPEPPVSGSGER